MTCVHSTEFLKSHSSGTSAVEIDYYVLQGFLTYGSGPTMGPKPVSGVSPFDRSTCDVTRSQGEANSITVN